MSLEALLFVFMVLHVLSTIAGLLLLWPAWKEKKQEQRRRKRARQERALYELFERERISSRAIDANELTPEQEAGRQERIRAREQALVDRLTALQEGKAPE